jgi:hypothetical protein
MRQGLITSGLNHLAHEVSSGFGGEDEDSTARKIKEIKSKIEQNNKDIGVYSAVMDALTETTAPGKVLTKIRKKIVAMYGDNDTKLLSKQMDLAKDVLSAYKNSAKISDASIYEVDIILGSKILSLYAQNHYYSSKIYYYQSTINISNYFTPKQVGGFIDGFGGGSFSGSSSGNRNLTW